MKFNQICRAVLLSAGIGGGIGFALNGSYVMAQEEGGAKEAATASENAHGAWQVDIDLADAFKQAKEEGKDVVVNFSGSDWCPPCIRLDETILSQKAFQDRVKDEFVLVNLDFPRDREQTRAVKARNMQAQEKYRIQGYPTLVLMDNEGHAYGETGFQQMSPTQYADHLLEMRESRVKRDALLAEAAKLEGVERAKKLDEAIEVIGMANAVNSMQDEITEIGELDANDEAGLKSKYAEVLASLKLEQAMQEVMMTARLGDLDGALKQLDTVIKEMKVSDPFVKQQMYVLKAQLLMGKQQSEAAMAAIEEAIAVDPDSSMGQQLKAALSQIRDEVAKQKEQAGADGQLDVE